MHCGGLRRVSVCVFLEMGLFKLSLIVVVNFMGGVMIRLLVRVVLPPGAAILGICGGLDGDFVEAQVRRRVSPLRWVGCGGSAGAVSAVAGPFCILLRLLGVDGTSSEAAGALGGQAVAGWAASH